MDQMSRATHRDKLTSLCGRAIRTPAVLASKSIFAIAWSENARLQRRAAKRAGVNVTVSWITSGTLGIVDSASPGK